MKIAFVIKEIKPNAGQTNTILQLIEYILKVMPEWKVTIFCNKNNGFQTYILDQKNVRIIELHAYYSSIILRKKLVKFFRNYDFISNKSTYPYFFSMRGSGVPYAIVLHQLDSLKLFSDVKSKLQSLGTVLMTRYIVRKSNALLTVTEELALFYRKKYGATISVISDSISNNFFKGVRKLVEHNRPVRLISVGYWDGIKGRKRQHVLFEILSQLKNYKIKTILTLVGLDNDNIASLNNLGKKYNIIDSINLLGYLSEEDLIKQYISNDIYVTATSFEGFYRQIIEAFATGMPALVYDSRLITNDDSQSASSMHVIKSNGGGELFYSIPSFCEGLQKIISKYQEYSKSAFLYSQIYCQENAGGLTIKLISETVLSNSSK